MKRRGKRGKKIENEERRKIKWREKGVRDELMGETCAWGA